MPTKDYVYIFNERTGGANSYSPKGSCFAFAKASAEHVYQPSHRGDTFSILTIFPFFTRSNEKSAKWRIFYSILGEYPA